MIKEDYCNYEMSMLLKEKGFNEYCSGYYKFDKSLGILSKAVINNSALDDDGIDISAPTHQMAMKWLREVHNVFIKINMIQDGMYDAINDFVYKEPIFQYEITGINGNDVYELRGEFNSYEEACEAAIKYVLENLI